MSDHSIQFESGVRAGISIRPSAMEGSSIKLGDNSGVLYTGHPSKVLETARAMAKIIGHCMESISFEESKASLLPIGAESK